ncbi:MAG: hypothetical protein JW829_14570 [Pirellulales bacterium]|nr:hypothetical protein [Pirellulales bacterium]
MSSVLRIWITGFGLTSNADTDGDGDFDGSDFLAWQVQYGCDLGGIADAYAASVPEPLTMALAVILLGINWLISTSIQLEEPRELPGVN